MNLLLLLCMWIACLAPSLAQQFGRRQVRPNCVTPERYNGYCVTLSQCPQVVNVFATQNRAVAERYVFSLQRSCGTQNVNGDPVVCCTRPMATYEVTTSRPVTQNRNPFLPVPQTTPTTITQPTSIRNTRNPQTENATRNPAPRPTATPVTVTSAPVIESRAQTCRGPDFRQGNCMIINQCQVLVNELIQKQNQPEFADFLRASNRICGGTGSIVCCPSNEQIVATTANPLSNLPNTDEIPRRLLKVSEGCGYSKSLFKKVVGGKAAVQGSWPWVALIGYQDDLAPFKCGGTLITARNVVTAAHCIRRDLTFVRLGEHDLTTDQEAQHVDVNVVRMVAHPEYSRQDGHSDIAMLFLERNVKFSATILPICIPSMPELRTKSYTKFTPFVVGWGKLMEGGKSSNVLQELQIPVLDNSVCLDAYTKLKRVFTTKQFNSAVLCAGVTAGGMDTCQGDSGGPLMIPESVNGESRFFLLGVVSYGIGCARAGVPGVYTSVQHFVDWIEQQVASTQ